MLAKLLKYVEIQTKITSLFPFLMVLAYLFATGVPIRWAVTALFFGAMLLIDLATTAINNFMDTKKNGLPLPVGRGLGLAILLILLLGGAALGLVLVALTDAVVFLVGGLCFLCGVFYTFGPVPFNHTPLGEIFSGLFYGVLIPFLLLYLNLPEGELLTLHLSWQTVGLQLQVAPLAELALLAVAPACATANIMLANNICDLEQDVKVQRHTLPYYLGRDRALTLYTLLTYGGYAAAVALVALGILPAVYLLLLLTAIPATQNLARFRAKQDKATTFPLSILNYLLLMGGSVALIFLSHWFMG